MDDEGELEMSFQTSGLFLDLSKSSVPDNPRLLEANRVGWAGLLHHLTCVDISTRDPLTIETHKGLLVCKLPTEQSKDTKEFVGERWIDRNPWVPMKESRMQKREWLCLGIALPTV